MSKTSKNLAKIAAALDSLHEELLASGKINSDDFLAVRSLGSLQEYLRGQSIHFKTSGRLDGYFLLINLSCRRPSSHQMCRIFVYDRVQDTLHEEANPLNFMKGLVLDTREVVKECQRSDLDVFEKPIFSWVKREVENIQVNNEADFLEEKERLNTYYLKQFEELRNKKKSVFFHNYFFEKEARIKEDIKQNHAEMKEQEDLLSLRYQPQFQIDILLHGSLSK